MLKTACAIAVAAIVAAGFVAFPSLSLEVQARVANASAKTDRADLRPLGSACSQQAWPYYEAACLRDSRDPLAAVRAVRMVSTDHLPASGPAR